MSETPEQMTALIDRVRELDDIDPRRQSWWRCDDCNSIVSCDEDGCCTMCGSDTRIIVSYDPSTAHELASAAVPLANEVDRLTAQVAEQQREIERLRRMIPVECCLGADPHCSGPRGCLVRANKADTTPHDVLVKEADDAVDAQFRAEAKLHAVEASRDWLADPEAEVVGQHAAFLIREIHRRLTAILMPQEGEQPT